MSYIVCLLQNSLAYVADLTWAFLSYVCILLRTRWVGLLRALWALPTVEALQLCFFYIKHNCTMLLNQMVGDCSSRSFSGSMVQSPTEYGAISHLCTKAQNMVKCYMFWMVLTMMTDLCCKLLILTLMSQKSVMCRPSLRGTAQELQSE